LVAIALAVYKRAILLFVAALATDVVVTGTEVSVAVVSELDLPSIASRTVFHSLFTQ